MSNVTETLATINDLKGVAIDALKLARDAKDKKFVALFADIVATGGDVEALVVDAPQALPELATIDAAGVAAVGAAAYNLVLDVIKALKAS